MNIATVLFVLSALLLLGGAVWLFMQAGAQEIEEDIKLRLRVTGSDDAGIAPATPKIRNPLLRGICHLFWRTGSEIKPVAVLQLLAGVLILGLLLAAIWGLLPAIVAITTLLLVAYAVLIQRASRRRIRIVGQLPAYLENVIRVLAAGNTLEESLGQAGRESPDPIKPLFISIGRQVRLGAPLEQVLAEAGSIHRLRDLKVMALAASINRKYGGSLRGVLKSLIVVIRQRASAAQELRALTAETRSSAFVLAGITVFLFAFIYYNNTRYYTAMLEDQNGKWLLFGSAALVVFGFVVLWRMLKSIDEGDS